MRKILLSVMSILVIFFMTISISAESKVAVTLENCEPGEYAITHYSPKHIIKMKNGKTFVIPAKIIEFREVVIIESVILKFGCEWKMKGAV